MRIALGTNHKKQPFAEFVRDGSSHRASWRIWLSFNNDITSGTYLELNQDGSCDRITVNNGQIIDIVCLTTGVVVK